MDILLEEWVCSLVPWGSCDLPAVLSGNDAVTLSGGGWAAFRRLNSGALWGDGNRVGLMDVVREGLR